MASNNKNVTEDVKKSWLNPVRAAQAACRDNKGYALVHLVLLVDKNDPVAWKEPEVSKIHPARLAEHNVSPLMLAALLEAIDKQVDNKNTDT
jgi:hypothetical protein